MGPKIPANRAELAQGLGKRRPVLVRAFTRTNGIHALTPEAVRRIIYTTNAIEALNSKLRRAVRTRGHFPNDDAAMKLLYLVLSNAAEYWKRPPHERVQAKNQFAILFEERLQSV